jgi:hypothetical protein
MPHYRAYHLDYVGHIWSVSEFECANDQEAIKTARGFVNGLDVELWERGRFINRIGPHGP